MKKKKLKAIIKELERDTEYDALFDECEYNKTQTRLTLEQLRVCRIEYGKLRVLLHKIDPKISIYNEGDKVDGFRVVK